MYNLHPWPIFHRDLDPPTERSLALQFVLQEFLSSCHCLERLENASSEELPAISSYLDQFLLSSLNNPFAQKGGALNKLCFYCEILLQASKIGNETILIDLEEMQHPIMKVRSKMILWKKQAPLPEEISSAIAELCDQLRKKFISFFSSLSPFLIESRTDENVLLYLIEHRQTFNFYLGQKTIENLLSRCFPAGYHELRATICEGYTRRGFGEFYTKQEPLIDTLERETYGCLSQSPTL